MQVCLIKKGKAMQNTLFTNKAFSESKQINTIRKGISDKNTAFDRLRKKMINELKKR